MRQTIKICFFSESPYIQTVWAHPVSNLLLHISRHTAVNFCTSSSVLFFEGSLDRATARSSSPGVTALPRPHSLNLSSISLIHSFSQLLVLSHTLFSSVHPIFLRLSFYHPQTHRGDGNMILFPAGFTIGYSGTSCLVILIEMWSPSSWNSTSAEINTAELCGLKHRIVKLG